MPKEKIINFRIDAELKNKAKKLVDQQSDSDPMKKSQLLFVLFAGNRNTKVTQNCIR